MDAFYDLETAPEFYKETAWLPAALTVSYGLLWCYTYYDITRLSIRDRTYGAPLLALCVNFSWELTYGFIYAAPGTIDRIVFATWMIVDIAQVWNAIKYGAEEFKYAPMVVKNMGWVFAVGMSLCLYGQVAYAAMADALGALDRATLWSALLCQIVLGFGWVAQLMSRGSSRGASWGIFLSRFIGSTLAPIAVGWRAYAWPEAYGWVNCPLFWWGVVAQFTADFWYLHLFYQIKKEEKNARAKKT